MAARDGFAASCCKLALFISFAAGCAAADSMSSAMHSVTPSFMLSDHDKAERNLKDPAALNLKYGQYQEQVGQTAEARKSYETALRDQPKSVDAILGIARLDQLAGKNKEAEAGFQKALKLKPDDPVVLAANGQFYASVKRWPESFQAFNAAIAAAPKEVMYKHQLAVAKTRSGDINGGLALFTAMVGPEKAHYNVARLLKEEQKPEAAAQQCRMALAVNPRFQPAQMLLAELRGPQQIAGAAPRRDPSTVMAGAALPAGGNPRGAFPENGMADDSLPTNPQAGAPMRASFQPSAQPPARPATASQQNQQPPADAWPGNG